MEGMSRKIQFEGKGKRDITQVGGGAEDRKVFGPGALAREEVLD